MQLNQLLNIVASGTKIAIYEKHEDKKLNTCYSIFIYGGQVEQVERSNWFQNNETATVSSIFADEYSNLRIYIKDKQDKHYIYIVDKCFITPYHHDICSYEEPIDEKFNTEEEAIADAKKYAFLLSENEVYSVERHVVWNDGTIEYDKEICLITNKDGE